MMITKNSASAWQATVALSTIIGSLIAACMMPFAALAMACAATMPRSRAAATMAAVWGTNQLLGFTVLGFPRDVSTFAWGVALGLASLLAMFVAAEVLARGPRTLIRFVSAFAAAFIAYEAGLFLFALVAGSTGAFSASIVAQILLSNASWCVVLLALHAALTRAVPRVFGPPLKFESA